MTETCAPPPTANLWLIDGFNVLHAGLLGGRDRTNWWTESRRRELVECAERFDGLTDAGAELWIVFDGSREISESEQNAAGPRCVFAPSADAWLVDRVRAAADPSQLTVVSADRQVAERARHHGAKVVTPRDFLSRCSHRPPDQSPDPPPDPESTG